MTTLRIKGFTLAVTNMEAMLKFYPGVFSVEFERLEVYGNLNQGKLGSLDVLFCPATVADNTAKHKSAPTRC